MKNWLIMSSLVILALVVTFSLNDNAYAMKFSCADDIDVQKYPFCKYVKEWNASEEYEDKVLEELATHVGHLDAGNVAEHYIEVREKVEQENPGLKEKCEELREWVLEQVRIDKENNK